MGKDLLVSIDCLAYNHENYIAEAIEGFLMQKTKFKIEILIHDDASTDRTAEVIREYEKKFPDIINPIYQKENQFSQGIKMQQVNQRRAKGKYIAICEGDDYWADPYKLQKQVDYLEDNPECSLCVHSAFKFSEFRKEIVGKVRPGKKNKMFSAEEIIEGGGELFPTNAMVYRRVIADTVPAFYFDAGVGDYPLTIYLAEHGDVYYMDQSMSVYRIDVKGAWSDRILSNAIKATSQNEKTANLLDMINAHTNYKYNETIIRTKKKNRFYLLLRQHKFKEAFSKENAEFFLQKEFVIRTFKKVYKKNIFT